MARLKARVGLVIIIKGCVSDMNDDNIKYPWPIDWFKPGRCEQCGQGAFLCKDPRCPSVMFLNEYEKRMERVEKRTWLQRIVIRIFNIDMGDD